MINDNNNDETFIFDSLFIKFLLSYFLHFLKIRLNIKQITYFLYL